MKKSNKISIIVPTLNEKGNIKPLLRRIDRSLKKAGIYYEVIFIDDHSTDGTVKEIQKAAKKYPIKVFNKRGKRGKAYSIIEGINKCRSRTIAFIDADLQYPPEKFPEMFKKLQNCGVVVADRKLQDTSLIRKAASRTYSYIFGKLVLGFNCDVQSGMKMFKKHLGEAVNSDRVDPWTFDMALLQAAYDLGEKIDTVDIKFRKRRTGVSKINIINDSLQIAKGAVKLRLNKRRAYQIRTNRRVSNLGSGLWVNNKKYITHSALPIEKSAVFVLTGWQKILLFMVLSTFIAGLLINPITTLTVAVFFITLLYLIDIIFGFFVIKRSLQGQPIISVSDKEVEQLEDADLPFYTILCPLYKEANVLEDFVSAIDDIDWPKNRLDVILLLEEDDKETLDKAKSMRLPDYVTLLVIPDSEPKTKPKACNYGLQFARGEYLVIYDAEDKPETDQLKKAYLAYRKAGKDVYCLQCKLNYYNPHHNLLTKLFTTEYSLWFDIILPGLQSIKATIPLGGTSNHFRTKELKNLHGWDPFNVTEDCDLGVRLFKEGKRTAIINSTTWEEANSKMSNWIKQRSRWIKGYLQTYLVHTRNPIEFIRQYRLHALYFHLVIGMRVVFILLNPVLWIMTLSYFLLNPLTGAFIESIYIAPVFYAAVFTLVVGNFMYFYNYMIGALLRQQWEVVKYVFFIPFYWVMASIAGYIAVYQLITKPHYWEKTKHGLHLKQTFKKVREKEENIHKHYNPGEFPNFEPVKDLVDINIARLAKINKKRLNVLMFNWRDVRHKNAGGAEVYIFELAKTWIANKHQVTVFCGNDGTLPAVENTSGIDIIRRGGFYGVYFWAFIYYLIYFRGKYDVVVDCSNGMPFFTPFYVGVAKVLLVHHVHEKVFRKYLQFPLSELAIFIEKHVVPVVYRNIKIVTVSRSSKLDLKNLGIANAVNAKIITPGVGWKSMVGIRKTRHPSIIYMGRVKEYKNIDIAIKAFKHVLSKIPNATFSIAGEGESLPELKKLARRLRVEHRIDFLGRVSEKEKIKLLAKSWIAVQPSEYEGWGITVIEANACATPVVAFDVNGLRDSIVNGKTGILVKKRSVKDYSSAVISVLVDKGKAHKISDNSYKWAKRFSWDKSAESFWQVIEEATIGPAKKSFELGGTEAKLVYQS
jgi:glycosyltransferase XagB